MMTANQIHKVFIGEQVLFHDWLNNEKSEYSTTLPVGQTTQEAEFLKWLNKKYLKSALSGALQGGAAIVDDIINKLRGDSGDESEADKQNENKTKNDIKVFGMKPIYAAGIGIVGTILLIVIIKKVFF